MTEQIDDVKQTLSRAMDLIGAQNAEIDMYKSALDMATSIQQEQQAELEQLQDQISELQRLLHVSDEGLSEALIVLSNIRAGLKKVNDATNRTVQSLNDAATSVQATDTLKTLANVVEDAESEEMLDEHEKYLKELRERLTRKKSSGS